MTKCPNWDCGYCHCTDSGAAKLQNDACPGYARCQWYAENVAHRKEVVTAPDDMFEVIVNRNETVYPSILHEAYELTRGERNGDYGHPLDDFSKTASMWSAICGVEVTPEMVALMMVCVKISRELNCHKRDNLVDACGYLSTIEMIQEERERRGER